MLFDEVSIFTANLKSLLRDSFYSRAIAGFHDQWRSSILLRRVRKKNRFEHFTDENKESGDYDDDVSAREQYW